MSKTYRKKGVKLPDWWKYDSKWVKTNNGYTWIKTPHPPNVVKSHDAKYHSDNGKIKYWRGMAPADFRRGLNRIKKAKAKKILTNIIKTGDYENYSFDPLRNDARWYYD